MLYNCILSKTLKVIPCEKKRIWSSAKLLDEPVDRVQFGIIVEEYQICLVTGNYVLFIFTVLSEFEIFLYIFLDFSTSILSKYILALSFPNSFSAFYLISDLMILFLTSKLSQKLDDQHKDP